MEVVEKNDVDITPIFNWGRVFELIGDSDEKPEAIIYMKLLGDADLNRSRVFALRESGDLRRRLKDKTSDEYLAYIQDINDVEVSDMIGLITVFSLRDITKKAKDQVFIKRPKSPKSDASLEEMETFQKEVDEYPKKREDAIKSFIEKETALLRESLQKESKDAVYGKYIKLLMNELCEKKALDSFREMQTYLGCYKDSEYKEKFFGSFEEFANLPTEMKNRFMDAYSSLDIDPTELKKLRRATP